MPAPNPEFSPSLLQARSGLPTESLDITASTAGGARQIWPPDGQVIRKRLVRKTGPASCWGSVEGRGVGEGRAVAARAGEKPRRGKLCVREYVRVALWRWYNSNTIARAALQKARKRFVSWTSRAGLTFSRFFDLPQIRIDKWTGQRPALAV